MLGCERRAAVRPSRLKRAPTLGSSRSPLKTFTATGRSKTSSLPRKITDMPPVPISRSRTNLPPKRLTVGRVPFRPSLNYLSAHGAREGLQSLAKTQERLDGERLLGVAEGLLGLVVGLHNQAVRLRRYARLAAAWDGSTITGRSVSLFATMTAERSSVKRVLVSNVRIPRSQRTTLSPPALVMYSAARSHSSTVAEKPLLRSTPWSVPAIAAPTLFKRAKFAMLRAPIWSI